MKKISLLTLGLFYFGIINASPCATDSIPVNQKDVESVNAIIGSLYNVISGPAEEKRNWDRMRTLFLADAKMIPSGKGPGGIMTLRMLGVEDYIGIVGPALEKNGFFETEVAKKTEQFGSIAHVFSTYESRKTLSDEKPFLRGINSIQLWNDGKRWWIVSVFWQAETTENPIPGKYLN